MPWYSGFTELRSQPLSPTPRKFSKTTHSHPLFNKNNPLPPIFNKNNPFPPFSRQNRPTPTHFSRKVTHSHSFLKKKTPLPPIIWQKRHTFTLISTITTHSHPFFKKKPTPSHFSTKTTHSYPFSNKKDPFPDFSIKRPTQFARIHTSSLIKFKKILNRPITKFYNSDDVKVIAQSYGSLKRGQLLYIRDNLL